MKNSSSGTRQGSGARGAVGSGEPESSAEDVRVKAALDAWAQGDKNALHSYLDSAANRATPTGATRRGGAGAADGEGSAAARSGDAARMVSAMRKAGAGGGPSSSRQVGGSGGDGGGLAGGWWAQDAQLHLESGVAAAGHGRRSAASNALGAEEGYSGVSGDHFQLLRGSGFDDGEDGAGLMMKMLGAEDASQIDALEEWIGELTLQQE